MSACTAIVTQSVTHPLDDLFLIRFVRMATSEAQKAADMVLEASRDLQAEETAQAELEVA
jgi:hypothetical protein